MLCLDEIIYHEFAIKLRQFIVILEDLVSFCSNCLIIRPHRTNVKRKRSGIRILCPSLSRNAEREYVGYSLQNSEQLDVDLYLGLSLFLYMISLSSLLTPFYSTANVQKYQQLQMFQKKSKDVDLCHSLKSIVDECLNSLNSSLLTSSSLAVNLRYDCLDRVTPLHSISPPTLIADCGLPSFTRAPLPKTLLSQQNELRKVLLIQKYLHKLQATLSEMITTFAHLAPVITAQKDPT
jgi:hypothetical protein